MADQDAESDRQHQQHQQQRAGGSADDGRSGGGGGGGSGLGDEGGGSASTEAGLACNSCRRRKLRCSREIPTCHQCRKTGSICVYETRRARPGMKAGAIDNLHRRLDALEKIVEQKWTAEGSEPAEGHYTPRSAAEDSADSHPYRILSFFAREFQRFNNSAHASSQAISDPYYGHEDDEGRSPAKRRRTQDYYEGSGALGSNRDHHHPLLSGVSSRRHDIDLELVLQAYFSHVHPWIPMLHEGRLRRRLSGSDSEDQRKLDVVVRAMVLVAARYVPDRDISGVLASSEERTSRSRDEIVATAMHHLSVENAQALAMMAFDDIGSGQVARAWPIVGALVRAVECLQLSTDGRTREPSLSRPGASLPPPQDWAEAEERRRVFWNALVFDRICAVTMGWKPSFASDDVDCRLPCDGISWRKENEVATPYFGILERSSRYPGHQQATVSQGKAAETARSHEVDTSGLGAFAYSIEATESLHRVTTSLLQGKFDPRDQRDLDQWLARFKELDLRLVHWKTLLSQKWKADTGAQHTTRMDPNLTVAHLIHNATVILLHQLVAFPPLPDWPSDHRLPRPGSSAEMCQAAAAEIAVIADNYLRRSSPTMPVSSLFAFCLYVAARVCLLLWKGRDHHHHHHHRDENSPMPDRGTFLSIVESLDTIARLWAGPHGPSDGRESESEAADTLALPEGALAAKYSRRLKELYRACSTGSTVRLHVLGYMGDMDETASEGISSSQSKSTETSSDAPRQGRVALPTLAGRRTPIDAGASPPPSHFQDPRMAVASMTTGQTDAASRAGLARKSSLQRPQHLDADRIIRFNDGMFGSGVDGSA